MGERTNIEWCDHTWSPVWGCTQVSKAETGGGGCDNCYAMALAHRFGTGWNGAPMREFGDKHWDVPVRWNKRAAKDGTRPKVFPSMCDPLDKDWPDALRERFWRLVDATPYLTWLILTKRIGNADRLGPGAVIGRWPANVWMGATVVNQDEADRDIPKLLATPAFVRFLSVEPMLGPIDLRKVAVPAEHDQLRRSWDFESSKFNALSEHDDDRFHQAPATINWVICGGESGPGARPMHPDWARSLRDQCAAAGVPFLFKQWGTHDLSYDRDRDDPDYRRCAAVARQPGRWINLAGGHGFNGERVHYARRVDKKVAGRLLDGVEHNGFPS